MVVYLSKRTDMTKKTTAMAAGSLWVMFFVAID